MRQCPRAAQRSKGEVAAAGTALLRVLRASVADAGEQAFLDGLCVAAEAEARQVEGVTPELVAALEGVWIGKVRVRILLIGRGQPPCHIAQHMPPCAASQGTLQNRRCGPLNCCDEQQQSLCSYVP